MIKSRNNVKHITASGGGTLTANTGESLMIRRVTCLASANDDFLTLRVNRTIVGYWRVNAQSGNHISPQIGGNINANLWDYLVNNGIELSIPVGEGQDFEVERYAEAGNVIIEYDIGTPEEFTAVMVNGEQANMYHFIQYMNVGTALTAAGDALFDTSLSPAGFPDFPCGAVVPSNQQIDLLGLVGSPWCDGEAGPAYFLSQKIKLVRDREVLLDEDKNGIPFLGDASPGTGLEYGGTMSLIGPSVPIALDSGGIANGSPFLFDVPLSFKSGEELNIYATMTMSGAPTWTTTAPDLAAILRVRKM